MNGYYLMQPINQSIYRILIDDRITEEEAVEVSANPEELCLLLKGISTAWTNTENLGPGPATGRRRAQAEG